MAGLGRNTTTLRPIREQRSLGGITRRTSNPQHNIDVVVLLIVGAIILVGCLAIYSSSAPFLFDRGQNEFMFVQRQVLFVVIGLFAMAAVMALDYGWIKEHSGPLYLLTIMVLVAVLIIGTGPEGSGANAWFDFGPILVQPSEFAKVTVLVLIAGYLADEESGGELSYTRFVFGLALVGVPVGLVMLQPDFGTASVLISLAMGVLLVAGANVRYIVFVTILALATVGVMVSSGFVREYQIARLTSFIETTNAKPKATVSDQVRQVEYAKRAITIGGMKGKGWRQGPITESHEIPVQWSDMVFSAWAEQFGLIGGLALLALYAALIFRIWRIARLARDDLGLYICAGAMTMIVWHVFENIGATMGIMPLTGIPLPLVSYGGSSAIGFLMMIGLVESVHMRRLR